MGDSLKKYRTVVVCKIIINNLNSFIGRNSANKIHHHRKKKLLKGKRRFLKIRRTNIRVCGFLYQEGCHVHVQVPADITLIDSLLQVFFYVYFIVFNIFLNQLVNLGIILIDTCWRN